MRRFIICIVLVLAMSIPAYAENGDTWCMYDEIAVYIHDYLPIAAGILTSMGVELPEALPVITAEASALLTELRAASMESDPDDAVKDVLIKYGLDALAENLNEGDWVDIWTGCDRVSPVMTAVFYRVNDDGVEEGYLLRVAWYLLRRGDIHFDDGEIITTTKLLNKMLAVLPYTTFTPEEEDTGILWLAEEIAAARNALRAEEEPMAASVRAGESDELPIVAASN